MTWGRLENIVTSALWNEDNTPWPDKMVKGGNLRFSKIDFEIAIHKLAFADWSLNNCYFEKNSQYYGTYSSLTYVHVQDQRWSRSCQRWLQSIAQTPACMHYTIRIAVLNFFFVVNFVLIISEVILSGFIRANYTQCKRLAFQTTVVWIHSYNFLHVNSSSLVVLYLWPYQLLLFFLLLLLLLLIIIIIIIIRL